MNAAPMSICLKAIATAGCGGRSASIPSRGILLSWATNHQNFRSPSRHEDLVDIDVVNAWGLLVPPGVDRSHGALGLVQGALECLQELDSPGGAQGPGRRTAQRAVPPQPAARRGRSRTPEPAAPQVTDQIAKTRFCRFWRVPGGGVERLDATGRCASRRPARLPSPGS